MNRVSVIVASFEKDLRWPRQKTHARNWQAGNERLQDWTLIELDGEIKKLSNEVESEGRHSEDQLFMSS